ncbi:hypothetical protein B0H14DRAFT_2564407 [Mycena olivaceomarginata]|nr:hypothetical protein B0H14DRAFT_2564407 [Mycena olivaceomarginata]
MEARITMLSSIRYVPSYKKPKPQPKLLDDEDAWEGLVSDVRQHIKGAQSKNRGKGQVQPFSILILDMSESGSEPSKGGELGVKKSKSNEDSLDTAGPAVKGEGQYYGIFPLQLFKLEHSSLNVGHWPNCSVKSHVRALEKGIARKRAMDGENRMNLYPHLKKGG